ncbi:hypothetical protein QTG56_11170 [Rossellomorea sp. AcN35-11]|nr:hypothetical protein [Rossellomorea aquimaris]WJV31427.1 hypothetical protein QTG56_11170 [Rossellomorea sp. AcN35-11]
MLRDYYKVTNFEGLDKMVKARIKSKNQLISIIVTSLKVILTDLKPNDENSGIFCLKDYGVKKRIFFTVLDEEHKILKHFSFSCPFNISYTDTGIDFKLNNREIVIDLYTLEILSTLCKNNWFSDTNEANHDILTFIESYGDLLFEFNVPEEMESDLWSIIMTLITFEPGYIRYDYDIDNFEEFTHPLHHIDVNFSDIGTFKLGFDESMNIIDRLKLEDFEDILLNGRSRASHCYTLS